MPRYPTKDEILSPRFRFKQPLLKRAAEWQEQHKGRLYSQPAIARLIHIINEVYKRPTPLIIFDAPYACYVPLIHTIFLKNNSMVSALHELGHHIYGSNEKQACRFSVQLFKRLFPEDFKKLKFDGHLLKKHA